MMKDNFNNKLSSSEPEEISTPKDEGEEDEEDNGNELEYYFSCHERMIKEYHSDPENDPFAEINKDDLRDNFTMPDLSRSTLVDQIDYDLADFKINESSVFESSSEDVYMSNRNQN